MDNERELPPEDLDALLDDLQKGVPINLPADQKTEGIFLGSLVNATRNTRLDESYATRLEKLLRNRRVRSSAVFSSRMGAMSNQTRQQLRRMALAATSLALVIVLGLSSVVGAHLPQANSTPYLPDSALNGLYAGTIASTQHTNALSSPQTQRVASGSTMPVHAVQAPDPPHTPLPVRNSPVAPPPGH